MTISGLWLIRVEGWIGGTYQHRNRLRRATAPLTTVLWSTSEGASMRLWRIPGMPARCSAFLTRILKLHFRLRRVPAPLTISILFGGSLDIENYCTIRASPACQRRCLRFLSALQLKIKGRDCGTINGHNESLSIRTLMKDAREVLVR